MPKVLCRTCRGSRVVHQKGKANPCPSCGGTGGRAVGPANPPRHRRVNGSTRDASAPQGRA